MNNILIELFNHNKDTFNTNIKKINTYIVSDIIYASIEQNYYKYYYNKDIDDNRQSLNKLLYDVIIARNSYNISLLLSNRLSKQMNHKCWLPSEIWNIINHNLKIELINKIKTYNINIPITFTIKNNYTIGNYDYTVIYNLNENGTIETSINTNVD